MELTNSSFQETMADTSFDSQKSSKTENSNSFKILLNEDYNTYTDILKKIYPYFEFNHYNKIKDEYYEYFKKYGDNDINNRNSKYNNNNNDTFVNKDYKKSNLLDISGAQSNIDISPDKLRIKDDLSFKMGIIDKELESILETHANKFYNYIETNDNFIKLISKYTDEIRIKIGISKIIKKNYFNNSMKLILKQKKKKELENLLIITYYMNDLKK